MFHYAKFNFFKQAGIPRFFFQVSPNIKPEALTEILIAKGLKFNNNWIKLAMLLTGDYKLKEDSNCS